LDNGFVIQILDAAAQDARPVRIFLPGGSFQFLTLDRPPLLDEARGVIQLIGYAARQEGYTEGQLVTLYAALNEISALIMDFDFK
jgi:hypothetical protein